MHGQNQSLGSWIQKCMSCSGESWFLGLERGRKEGRKEAEGTVRTESCSLMSKQQRGQRLTGEDSSCEWGAGQKAGLLGSL